LIIYYTRPQFVNVIFNERPIRAT